ncbi:hypothetical protein GNY06_05230 [Elizabethkingia argentiflava]|uniref:Uncharacterized protein n=1 Tax=Elizabethkingia argenteiflava TaxID=2681556 RepID=A0A845PWV8_9FLAO|nr:hypothetical protein [Elizabethkingia argenteiflava]NAW50808.1 hypothetical protein [Elizabethkingia argenteiflava]
MNKYKLSRYLVFTKNTISLKYHIVYSTLSNKILALDKNVVSLIQNGNFNEVDDSIMNKLIEYEFVTNIETDELKKVVERFKNFIINDNLLYQVIQPSANCQLGCNY